MIAFSLSPIPLLLQNSAERSEVPNFGVCLHVNLSSLEAGAICSSVRAGTDATRRSLLTDAARFCPKVAFRSARQASAGLEFSKGRQVFWFQSSRAGISNRCSFGLSLHNKRGPSFLFPFLNELNTVRLCSRRAVALTGQPSTRKESSRTAPRSMTLTGAVPISC